MRIETGCRLHFGLIDLNGNIGRVDGGVGLSLENPGMIIEGELSDEMEVTGAMSNRAAHAVQAVQEEIEGDPVRLKITSIIPQHVGLGSGTQVALASGRLTSLLNESELSVDKLAKITGRGGTSGIGTAAFDNGGFIVDGGHNFEEKDHFVPSSVSNVGPPPVIARYDFPPWEIAVFIPEGEGAYGRQEFGVFNEACPIDPSEVGRLSRVIIMKLLPSIKTADFRDFKESIQSIQQTGFKKEEVKRQPKSAQLIEDLTQAGYAAGLSSLGPAVFAVHPDSVDQNLSEYHSFSAKVNHGGARISP